MARSFRKKPLSAPMHKSDSSSTEGLPLRSRSIPIARIMLLLAISLGGIALAGCQTAHVAHPLTESLAGNDPDSQMDFWHTLADRHVTSNDEAFHGILLFFDGKDDSATYAQRVATLKSRKMLPANFSETSADAVRRGTLAVVIVQGLAIKGGWAMHAFGPTERYALRELVYMDLYTPSSVNQTFSGSEFLGIVGKLEDYQQQNPQEQTMAEAK
jgi:hypothetical protein